MDNQILNTVKIEVLIGEYVILTQRGTNYLGLCPFHEEKTPSFTVSPSRQLYKCFGCGKSGNAISFIMEYKKFNYYKACEYLDDKFNFTADSIMNTWLSEVTLNSYGTAVIQPIIANLDVNIQSVRDLMNFDNTILDFCILHIEELNDRILNNRELQITNVRLFPGNSLQALRSIKKNDSFSSKYHTVYNQCIVLLISYLTSSLLDLFRDTFKYFIKNYKDKISGTSTDFKISLEELSIVDFDLSNSIGELILKKRNISFQDMQSTLREFETYFNVQLDRTINIDNIIFAQASRHCIIHSLSIADEKFINQISSTKLRTLKTGIVIGQEIAFRTDEVEDVIENMKLFIRSLSEKLIAKSN